jgi:dTDP-4-amino-4,6-dideoxygalactose transaminase
MKHPAYVNHKKYWESIGDHKNADNIMYNFLMLGVSQVNNEEHIDRVIETLDNFWKLW